MEGGGWSWEVDVVVVRGDIWILGLWVGEWGWGVVMGMRGIGRGEGRVGKGSEMK